MVDRRAGGEADIGAKALPFPGKQREQLGADRVGLRLERRQPGEMRAREEFQRGQIGEMAVDGLLHIDLAAPGGLFGIGFGAAEVRVREGRANLGQRRRQRRRAAIVLGSNQLLSVRQRRARRGRQDFEIGAGGDDRAVKLDRLARPVQPLQHLRLLDQSGDEIGIGGERAVEAGEAALEVAGQLMRLEEIVPGRRRARIGRRRPFEMGDRAPGIAAADRDQRQRIQRRDMVGMTLDHLLEQRDRRFASAFAPGPRRTGNQLRWIGGGIAHPRRSASSEASAET